METLIEEGRLGWDTTLAELFPEMSERMDTKLRKVTASQLLSHTSGVSPETMPSLSSYSCHPL